MIAFFMAALVPIPALRAFSLQVRVCILSVSTCLEPLRPVMPIQKKLARLVTNEMGNEM